MGNTANRFTTGPEPPTQSLLKNPKVASMANISFAATGDSFISRQLPAGDRRSLEIARIINQADFRFTNLETVIRHDEGFPAAQSGGTWASASPALLKDLLTYGFNVVAVANNHTMDYSYDALKAMQKYLQQHGLVHVGIGQNLAQASEPQYIECPQGRVACIGASSSFPPSAAAGDQRRDAIGRPGLNPLHVDAIHQIHRKEFEQLQHIAQVSQINAARNISIKEGYTVADAPNVLRFGQHLFELVDDQQPQRQATRANENDQQRILKAVDQARQQADLVVVSIHAHELRDGNKQLPADFLVDFAHACIDAGAHAIIGHGPHILRGIEIYRQRPIFYSLGNFIFQSDTVPRLPADFYTKYSLGQDHGIADAFNARSQNDTTGLVTNADAWQSVIASWRMVDGKLATLKLHPLSLGFGQPRYHRGWPELTNDSAAIRQIAELSKPFGTQLTISGSTATWSI